MKRFKFFHWLIALALVLTLGAALAIVLPERAAAATAADVTVYINGTTGNDANDGLTEATAVQTYEKAYEIVFAEMAELGKDTDPNGVAKIVLTAHTAFKTYNTTLNAAIYDSLHVFRVILTSKTGAERFSMTTYTTEEGAETPATTTNQCYLSFVGPTTLENITVRNSRTYWSIHAATEADLIIGENVKTVATSSGYYPTLVGSPKKPEVAGPSPLIVHSGNWERLYPASYAATPSTSCGYLYMDGGTAKVVAPTLNSNLTLPTVMRLKNVTVGTIYAMHARNEAKTYTGDITIDLDGVTVTDLIALDGSSDNTLEGDLYFKAVNSTLPNEFDTTNVLGSVYDYADCAVIYVDQASGNDSYEGYRFGRAKKTLSACATALKARIAEGRGFTRGKIVVVSDFTLGASSTGTSIYLTGSNFDFEMIITGKTPDIKLISEKNIQIRGDTVLENITVQNTYNGTRFIYGNGHHLTIGENVTSLAPTASSTAYYRLSGGNTSAAVDSTYLTVKSGTWAHIYIGGYSKDVTGNARLEMYGGTSRGYIQSSYSGSVGGNVTALICNTEVHDPDHIGVVQTGTVGGSVTFTLGEGAVVSGKLYAGCRESGSIAGTSTLILDGGTFSGEFYGRGQEDAASLGASRLILRSGTFSGTVFDTGTVIVDTSEGGTLNLDAPLTADTVAGGGAVVLGAGAKLTVTGSVSGATALSRTDASVPGALASAPLGTPESAFAVSGAYTFTENGSKVLWTVLPDPSALAIAGRTLIFDSTFTARYLLPEAVFDAYFEAGMTVTSFTVTVNETVTDLSGIFTAPQIITVDGVNYYWAAVSGIAPKDTAATGFTFDLVCSYGGGAYTDTYTDSVKNALAQAAETGSAEFRTSANATLAYCAAAAAAFGKDATAFVFDPVSPVTTYEEIASYTQGSGEFTFRGTSLIFKEELALRFWALPGAGSTASINELTLKVNGVAVEAEKEVNGGYFVFKVAVPIAEMKTLLSVELFLGDASVSNVYTDSVLNYGVCLAKVSYGFGAEEKALGQAVVDYVHYTNAYLDTIA